MQLCSLRCTLLQIIAPVPPARLHSSPASALLASCRQHKHRLHKLRLHPAHLHSCAPCVCIPSTAGARKSRQRFQSWRAILWRRSRSGWRWARAQACAPVQHLHASGAQASITHTTRTHTPAMASSLPGWACVTGYGCTDCSQSYALCRGGTQTALHGLQQHGLR